MHDKHGKINGFARLKALEDGKRCGACLNKALGKIWRRYRIKVQKTTGKT
jgi:hypothetical protein